MGRTEGVGNRVMGVKVRLTEREIGLLKDMSVQDDMRVSSFVRWLVRQEATRRGLWHTSVDVLAAEPEAGEPA